MNKKAYFNIEQAMMNTAFMLGALFIFWILVMQPGLHPEPIKQSAIDAVTELQDNYNLQALALEKCNNDYNNTNNKDYVRELEEKYENTDHAWTISWIFIIFLLVILLILYITQSEIIKRRERIIEDKNKEIKALEERIKLFSVKKKK